MKTVHSKVAFLLLLIPSVMWAGHVKDFSGSTWGELTYPETPEPGAEDDIVLQGGVTQNLAHYGINDSTQINYSVKFGYTFDTEEIGYNNKLSLGPSVSLQHSFANEAVVSLGVMYQFERLTKDDKDYSGPVVYMDWWDGWRLPCSFCSTSTGFGPKRLPGSTVGELRYPASFTEEEDNSWIVEGSISQGIDWLDMERFGTLNTFIDLAVKADTQEVPWNNSVKYGFGIKLSNSLGDHVGLDIGVKFAHERKWVSDTDRDDVLLFLTWDASWN